MEFSGFKCDGCGREKSEANHWFRAFVQQTELGPKFAIATWEQEGLSWGRAVELHFCGLECATKGMQASMTGGKL